MAAASLASSTSTRSGILVVAYTGGWFLNRPGLQVLMVVPDTDEPWKRASVPFATSASSWSTVMMAATSGLRRTRVPTPIGALLLGGAAFAIDSYLADLGEKREAAAASERETESADPLDEPDAAGVAD